MNSSVKAEIELLSEIAEMRRIYAAIENAVEHPGAMRIIVGSAAAGEGKTLVSAGLAGLASLQGEKRVLAIDLNWFRPALHECFGLERIYDVDALRNEARISDLAQPSGMDRLEVLTAPRLDPGSSKLFPTWTPLVKKMVKQARDAYDILIMDTSAMFPANRRMIDPVTFSRLADGVALVAMGHVTRRQTIMRAKMTLETSGVNVLGVIFNQQNAPR